MCALRFLVAQHTTWGTEPRSHRAPLPALQEDRAGRCTSRAWVRLRTGCSSLSVFEPSASLSSGGRTHQSTPGQPRLPRGQDTQLHLMKTMLPAKWPVTWAAVLWCRERRGHAACGPAATRPSKDAHSCPREAGQDPRPPPSEQRPSRGSVTPAGCGEGNPCLMETPYNTMWKSHFKNRFYFHFEAKENSRICFSLLVTGKNRGASFCLESSSFPRSKMAGMLGGYFPWDAISSINIKENKSKQTHHCPLRTAKLAKQTKGEGGTL